MLYEYVCPQCPAQPGVGADHTFDAFASVANRDEPKQCPRCKRSVAVRVQIPMQGATIKPQGGYQMAAVTKKGQTIPGSFGKTSKKKNLWGYR